MMMMMMNELKR